MSKYTVQDLGNEGIAGLQAVLDRTAEDPEFRTLALNDPHAAIREELGVDVRAIVSITELVDYLHGRVIDGKVVLDDAGRSAIESYLSDHRVEELMDHAYVGAAHVITSAGRPNMSVHLDDVSERSLGGLFYMLELSTVMSAELYGIDAFYQVRNEVDPIIEETGRLWNRADKLAAYHTAAQN